MSMWNLLLSVMHFSFLPIISVLCCRRGYWGHVLRFPLIYSSWNKYSCCQLWSGRDKIDHRLNSLNVFTSGWSNTTEVLCTASYGMYSLQHISTNSILVLDRLFSDGTELCLLPTLFPPTCIIVGSTLVGSTDCSADHKDILGWEILAGTKSCVETLRHFLV